MWIKSLLYRNVVNVDTSINMSTKRRLTAQEVAERLGINVATVYAYVSRGQLRSEPGGTNQRTRMYLAEEVDRLVSKKEQRKDPARVAQTALNWGPAVLDSSITRIESGDLYYRGESVRAMALMKSVEQVAAMIWTDGSEPISFGAARPIPKEARAIKPIFARMHAVLALEEARDETAFDLRTPAVVRSGARILALLVETACGRAPDQLGIAQTLADAWAPRDPHARVLLSAALIMCADHELNISAFTARCTASAGSTPYAAVSAGLHALAGFKHGGESLHTEALLNTIAEPSAAKPHVAGMLRRGERVPGFGHRLYPDGDPRALTLLDELARLRKSDPIAKALARAMHDLAGERPTIDFALALISRLLNLPAGTPLVLFALGRTIGFIGHAIEQYEAATMIRPRARYVGR